MPYTVTRYEMILRALTPIAHHQETLGNQSIFARKKVRLPGGTIAQLPYLSGDCLRHQLREAGVYATLEAAGMLDDPQLSLGALRLLFAGGMVGQKGDRSVINLDTYRALTTLFPPLALFGGCTDAKVLSGQLNVEEGNVICIETLELQPDWVRAWLTDHRERVDSFRASMEEVQRVRMDPEEVPEKRKLLSESAQIVVNDRLLARERAHEDADSKAAGENKSAMLPRTLERLIEGTLFSWSVEARTYTDLEFDAFNYIVGAMLNNCNVGGKRGTGHGRLKFLAGSRIHFRPTSGDIESMESSLAPKTGDLYRQHIKARATELKQWLQGEVAS